MATEESATSKAERLERSRRRMLVGGMAGFGVWWGIRIFRDLTAGQELDPRILGSLLAVSLLGWLYWTVHLVRTVRLSREIRSDPKLAMALNDERVQEVRLKSFAAAAWIMLLTQGALLIAAIFLDLPAGVAPEITIFVGVIGAIACFLHYDRE